MYSMYDIYANTLYQFYAGLQSSLSHPSISSKFETCDHGPLKVIARSMFSVYEHSLDGKA